MECKGVTTYETQDSGGPVISIRNVSAAYGARRVLRGVNLDVYRGEILVLLGASGSGKTTLLRQVLGLMKPDAGAITIDGVDITTCSETALQEVRRRIGVAFQAGALFNSLRLQENVAFPLHELTKLADSTIQMIAWMKLMAVGLADARDLYPLELSGGMKKRAAVARAIALDPHILVFDEPSSGLDPVVSAGLDELILFLKKAFQMTIFVVTHELQSAFRIADRLALLYNGSLIAVDRKEQFARSPIPQVRQFLDRQPDGAPQGAIEAFIDFILRGPKDEH
jgi:phospholipid/cholesterol/gamma-HCH transport system ATP-binding protein